MTTLSAIASLAGLTIHKGIAGVLLYVAAEKVSFSTSTAIFLGELMKLVVSFAMLSYDTRNKLKVVVDEKQHLLEESEERTTAIEITRDTSSQVCAFTSQMLQEVIVQTCSSKGAALLVLASTLYFVQNYSFLVASKYLEPALLSALWQLRIIATAIASVTILGRRFSGQQTVSMLLLIVSVVFINEALHVDKGKMQIFLIKTKEQSNLTSGLIAIFVATVISGVAGVIVELVLKNAQTNMWMANCQMSIYSIAPALFLMFFECYQARQEIDTSPTGFDGFGSAWPWVTVFFHGGAGLLVAFVTKYASTVAKTFSGAFSIIITLAISVIFDISHRSIPSGLKLLELLLGIALLFACTYTYAYFSPTIHSKLEKEQHGDLM